MKFKVKAEKMRKALDVAEKFRNDRTPVPAMAGFLVSAEKGSIVVRATDSEAAVKVTVKPDSSCMEIVEPGTALFPAKLKAVVSACDAEILTIGESDGIASVRYAGSKFKLSLMDANDYPRVEFTEDGTPFTVSLKDFASFVKSVSFAAAAKNIRPALEGVHMTLKGNTLTAEATDSYRVATNVMSAEADNGAEAEMLIRAKIVERFSAFPGEKIRFYVSDAKKVVVKAEDDSFKVKAKIRVIDAAYPNISNLMRGDNGCDRRLVIDKDSLLAAVDRASLFALGTDHHMITLNLSPDKCTVTSASNEIGSSDEQLENWTYNGESGTYSFDLRYIKDALKHVGNGELQIDLSDGLRPVYVHIDGSTEKHIILPIRTM